MRSKIKATISGLATYFPGYTGISDLGEANTAVYCYSVLLRHLQVSQLPCENYVKHPQR